MAADEVVEYEESESSQPLEEASVESFLPADTKPKSDVWTILMVLCFACLLTSTWLVAKELNEFYHFRMFGILSVPGQQPPPEEPPAPPTAPPAPAPESPAAAPAPPGS